jgi:hypothetical protein
MTHDNYWAARIKEECMSPDATYTNHIHADELLTDLLLQLGYKETVEAWNKIDKWYA